MKNKVVLITGASSGIGKSTAEAFAAKGAHVVLAARRKDELDSLVASIKAGGGKASAIKTDVSITKDVQGMVAYTIDTYGRLDYAINNAGIEGELAPITELPEDVWDSVMNINLKGVFLCMKYQAKAMIKGGHSGAIVNVGSVNSFLGFPSGAAYVTSKHGLVGLTTSVSAELAPQGIRVNLVCPGITKTPMHDRLRDVVGDDLYDKGLLPTVHLQRAGRPEEMANAIVFLCSDQASYITGSTLTVDGGLTLTM
ncbi:short chain dehydrogenase [Psychroflexus gondwanensis ACAM 44]|jgi:NAD(P)-dependent dehydrogenase (short-subunit alcohol dehydrogenase family)|uniref:Short chain dehydrogenase n=1 Tax=Psychroflexus gondwanensis ACAM 44 TaxID=1189619 RepID=N1WKC5_9FLAO|nr:glucose 1-dehydrogenase [Psychroflexus gondwanensis]EMY80686.1 short chain dehydrogenase [Psychroflexus gondwanensis ACAM 44]